MCKEKMAEEYPTRIKLYDHISNSGIVHLPGRRFPAVAIQGDTLSSMLSSALELMESANKNKDEDMYYEAQELAKRLYQHLKQYESVLESEGFEKPYSLKINELNIDEDFKNT